MTTATAQALYSPEAYDELEKHSEERHEYYFGKLITMPGESIDANRIGNNCQYFFEKLLGEKGYDILRQAVRLRVAPAEIYRYPDLVVVSTASIVHSHEVDQPELIVEVCSEESSHRDRSIKLKEYTEHFPTLQHYLIIDQYEPFVEVFTRKNGDWLYQSFNQLNEEVPLPFFDTRLPLRQIYQKVAFSK